MTEFVQPRALVHRGTIEARALFFDAALIGETAARRRVVQNWSSGAQVYEVAGGYLLRLSEPRRMVCNAAPGCPLTEEKGLLLAAPLADDEQHALEITSESLVLLRGGAAQVFPIVELKPIDVSTWLDMSQFQTLPMISLGEAAAPPLLLVKETPFDVREKLGVEASPELEKLLAQMQGASPKNTKNDPFFVRWMAALSGWWQSLTQPREKTASPASTLAGGANVMRQPSIWVGLLVMALVACGAMALTSMPMPKVNFSALVFAIIAALVLYAAFWILWIFLSSTFTLLNASIGNRARRKWWLWGIVAGVILLFVATGNGFADLGALLSKIVTLLLVVLSVLLIGALLITSLVWGARQVETALKAHNEARAKPKKTAAPAVNDVPLPWVILGAAIGVLFGAMGRGDANVASIASAIAIVALIWGLVELRKQRGAKAKGIVPSVPAKATPKPKPLTSLMPPEPVEGLFATLRNALARMAWMAGLWRIYGPIQARYIARLMDMFARGDLDNALRHAIPMGGAGTGKAPPAFGLPMPRALLEIFTGRHATASVLPMPPDIAEQLRQQYRAAFERLEAQGRHEEAAFVLAELLHASAEAVAYLERQGRLRLAAELAESRDLSPDLIVRQWLVAGEQGRAIWIARRKNAFFSAIARLENGNDDDKKIAQKLRLLWANELARGGDFVAAVSAAWPVAEARHLVEEWMKRGLLLGGAAKARMLAWQCQTATSLEPELREMVLDFLNEDEAAPARLVFAKYLIDAGENSVTKTIARPTARALTRDAGHDIFNETRKEIAQELIKLSGDGALRADIPARLFVSSHKPLKKRDQPVEIVIESADTGALPLYDAAFLPDGRTIVALGEAGARLLSRDGKTIAHFDQPCHRLVLSDQGDRALALAPRGEATRIAKLDFATRRATSWCETRIANCAYSYDGSLWFVAAEGNILAIDTTSQKFGALWHTSEVGEVACIERSPHSCAFLTRFITRENFGFRLREKWERWQLEVPSLILRQRSVITDWGRNVDEGIMHETFANAVAPDGIWTRLSGGHSEPFVFTPQNITAIASQTDSMIYGLQLALQWWLALTINRAGVGGFLIDREKGQLRAHFALEGAQYAQARFSENHLTLCDDRGRLLVFDLERGALIKNFRVS